MAIKDSFIGELKHESSLTKKMLERVPLDKKDWKPHEKSMSLGRLATHVAENTHWVSDIHHIDDFDFLKDYSFKPATAKTTEELLRIFQTNLDKAIADLSDMSDDDFSKNWTVRRGETVMFSTPKKIAIRGWAFNHVIHHRGQLSVYLRLLDVAVPGMYGPSADEKM
ncbi:MAG TPA: DinB family protein [Chitinophagaceae bacterium]